MEQQRMNVSEIQNKFRSADDGCISSSSDVLTQREF